ncbi:peptidyl-prolyl cis-trans isomerase, putative [Plasmodium gallinaceum]|uniref:Peptidyl-prolyl cis-trans isomerase n=1 Tax=Plasmodium gallinaceum TaxID=5849 RepID=A0A1J1GTZ3_PLAGA|nr:peptidyl-prolyl cis-trans isomerase, putative [Plasmodium gallinaceum]CRG95980.1 peptidyl-prolyl cis-trans isomerase, putative [Plasmodium gallinaceum]
MKIPNPRVYLDVAIGGRNAGRMIFELFMDKLPITCENFRCLCTGETGLGYYLKPRWYKNTPIHRIVTDFMFQGGDFNFGNGFGGESIYGQYFRNEKFIYKHSKRGVLSMCQTRIKHTNNSQFFVTFKSCPWLDKKHVVFGHLEYGFETLSFIEEQSTLIGKPKKQVYIYNCGEIPLDKIKYKSYRNSSDDYIIPDIEMPLLEKDIDFNENTDFNELKKIYKNSKRF